MEFNLLNLLMVLLLAAVCGGLFARFGYPALMGEMLAGMVFGPMLLGWIHGSEGLSLLAEIGVFLMMLYIGIEVDHRDLMKASWAGLMAAAGGFFVPFVAGFIVMRIFFAHDITSSLFVGLVMGITSLATKSRALMELKLLGTRFANVLLAAALVCDTLGLVVFAGITGLAGTSGAGVGGVLLVLVKALAFFGIATLIGIQVFPWIGRLFRVLGFTERTTNFTLVILVGLVFAEMAEIAGLHSIIGAFFAGLFIREEVLKRKVSHEVSALVRDVSLGFLAPVFFVSAGFKIDLSILWNSPSFVLILLGVALFAKLTGTMIFCLFAKVGWREGLAIGAGMNGQGAVAIIVAEIALEMGLVDESLYSLLVMLAFFTTGLEPFLLKLSGLWLKRSGVLTRSDDDRRLILIASASPLARLMARELAVTEKVLLIDTNANLVQAAQAEGFSALQGNVLNEDLLDLAGAAGARVFIAMTANHEVNRLSSTMAREMFGVPQVWSWPQMGVPALPPGGNATDTSSGDGVAPGQAARWNDWIVRKEVSPVAVNIVQPMRGTNFSGILIEHKLFPLVVERKGRRIPAVVADDLLPGDILHGIRREERPAEPDVFTELLRACPVVDVSGRVDYLDVFRRAAEVLSPGIGLPPDTIVDLLKRREEESSTVVTDGLAIPHVIIDGDQPVALAVVRCRDGVVFPGADAAAPVRFIFTIIGARSARNLHLRILSAIAQLFQNTAFEDLITVAPDEESVRRVILEARRRRT